MTLASLASIPTTAFSVRIAAPGHCAICKQEAAPLGLGLFCQEQALCVECGAKRAPALAELLRLRERMIKAVCARDSTARGVSRDNIETVFR